MTTANAIGIPENDAIHCSIFMTNYVVNSEFPLIGFELIYLNINKILFLLITFS